jgi:ElaB/YqjD/DUF883 family membrane-anchored ribosome-binding protein
MQSKDADKSAKPPSSTDRVAFLDQLLCSRLAEVEAAEGRLAKRLEQVNAAEQRLVNLQTALSQSNSAAGTTINQLAEFRSKAQETTASIIQAAQGTFAKLAQSAQKVTSDARELMDSLPRSVAARIEVLKGEVERTLRASQERVASQCEDFEHKAMVFEEWLENQTNLVQKNFEAETAKAVSTIKREWQEKAAKRLLEEEYRVGTLISCLESRVGELVGTFENDLFQKAGAVQSNLDSTIQSAEAQASELRAKMSHRISVFEQGANNVAGMVENVLRQAMHEMHEKAMAASGPMLEQLEAELMKDLKVRGETIQKAVSGKSEEIKKALGEHVEELCAAGEEMFEQAEERIGQRVRDIRPEAAAALDAAGDMLNQRLGQMLSNARGMMELTESQLSRRIEGLSGRAAAAMRTMEAELAEKLAKLEQEAHSAATAIEERLTAHAHEMLARERRIIAPGGKGRVELFVKRETDSTAA